MSFISNPLSRRVGISHYWQNIWSITTLSNYSLITNTDRILILYLICLTKLFEMKLSHRYKKRLTKLILFSNLNKSFRNEWFWLWPDWKIIRSSTSLSVIGYFRIQKKFYLDAHFIESKKKKYLLFLII